VLSLWVNIETDENFIGQRLKCPHDEFTENRSGEV
jgi:hypothetical protein